MINFKKLIATASIAGVLAVGVAAGTNVGRQALRADAAYVEQTPEEINLSAGSVGTDEITWTLGSKIKMTLLKGTSGSFYTSKVYAPRVYQGNILKFDVLSSAYQIKSIAMVTDTNRTGADYVLGTETKTNTDGKLEVVKQTDTNLSFAIGTDTKSVQFDATNPTAKFYLFNGKDGATPKNVQLRPTKVTITYLADPAAVVTTTSLTLTANPNKVTYNNGDKFDSTGLKVTANLSNGTTKDVTNDVTLTPKNGQVLTTENNLLTVAYDGKQTTLPLTVNAVELPSHDIYLQGASFDISNAYGNDDMSANGIVYFRQNSGLQSNGGALAVGKGGAFGNKTATPLAIKRLLIAYDADNNYDPTVTVYASTKANDVSEANLVEPVKGEDRLYTYDLTGKNATYFTVKSGPSFSVYIDMVTIEMESEEMSKARALATELNTLLDGYCGTKAVDSTVWNTIKGKLDADATSKAILAKAVYNTAKNKAGKECVQPTEIQHFVERHDYIVTTYGLANLLGTAATPANINANTANVMDANLVILISSVVIIAVTAIAVLAIVKSKKAKQR